MSKEEKLLPNGTEVLERANPRGFKGFVFIDRNNEKCSLQESSLATNDAIWLGLDQVIPKILIKGKGWQNVPLPDGTLIAGRMHLTQAQVQTLLPALQYFAERGVLPDEPPQPLHSCGCHVRTAPVKQAPGYWAGVKGGDPDELQHKCCRCGAWLHWEDYENAMPMEED